MIIEKAFDEHLRVFVSACWEGGAGSSRKGAHERRKCGLERKKKMDANAIPCLREACIRGSV